MKARTTEVKMKFYYFLLINFFFLQSEKENKNLVPFDKHQREYPNDNNREPNTDQTTDIN